MTSWRLHKKGPGSSFLEVFSPLVVLTVNNIQKQKNMQSNLNYACISDKKAAYEIANNKST